MAANVPAVSFAELHAWWAWVMVIANAVAGVWALLAHGKTSLRTRAMWVVTAGAQGSVALQALLGVLVLRVDGREVEQLHVIYGFVALASVGILYSYRQQMKGRLYLLYGFGGIFLMGLTIRAMVLTG